MIVGYISNLQIYEYDLKASKLFTANVSVGYCVGKDECKLDEPNDVVRLINAVDSSAINFGFVAVK